MTDEVRAGASEISLPPRAGSKIRYAASVPGALPLGTFPSGLNATRLVHSNSRIPERARLALFDFRRIEPAHQVFRAIRDVRAP